MSETELVRTILRMNAPLTDPDQDTFAFVVVDFSSWCTSIRGEVMAPLLAQLDGLFGFKRLYGFTHHFHLLSYVLFTQKFNPPKAIRHPEMWLPEMKGPCTYGPLCWFEGLR